MCELFGISGKGDIQLNEYLKTFFSHSDKHPNGWGIALFQDDDVNIEKEPLPAYKSRYLKERLSEPFYAQNMLAHIRFATRGNMEYANCHPFSVRDNSKRAWTLIHNGTIFHCPALDKYIYTQKGATDSERILLFIIDTINQALAASSEPLSAMERFRVIEEVILQLAPSNKLNLILYDGELLYVHKNYRSGMVKKEVNGSVIFATVPLSPGGWDLVALSKLEAYKDGRLFAEGTAHPFEYLDNPDDMQYIFLDYSQL